MQWLKISVNNFKLDKLTTYIIDNFIEGKCDIVGIEIKSAVYYDILIEIGDAFGLSIGESQKVFAIWAHQKLQGPYMINQLGVNHYYVMANNYPSLVSARNRWRQYVRR